MCKYRHRHLLAQSLVPPGHIPLRVHRAIHRRKILLFNDCQVSTLTDINAPDVISPLRIRRPHLAHLPSLLWCICCVTH